MYYVIAYLIGNIKYKDIHIGQYNNRQEAIDKYRKLLDDYIDNKEFAMVLLDDKYSVLTCWALQTPKPLIEAQKMALNQFESGEDLYINPNITLINIFGSTIVDELKQKALSIENKDMII